MEQMCFFPPAKVLTTFTSSPTPCRTLPPEWTTCFNWARNSTKLWLLILLHLMWTKESFSRLLVQICFTDGLWREVLHSAEKGPASPVRSRILQQGRLLRAPSLRSGPSGS